MSIPYRLTPLKDNISSKPKQGFYAQIVTRGTIETADLCQEISERCTLTTVDLRAAIEALCLSVSAKLKAGYNVCIDELGTFSLSAESDTVISPEEMSADNVRVKKIHFRPSVRMKKSVKNSEFEQVKTKKNSEL
ncbi:MAG: HU family DNA-binding protein [Bacteroidaceae bacterium]|nr:HU family DNA-binding protein [Bacteroidaceae bacterium]MDO4957020.1 HU family DNA-binding protein [Bacteroidales bacterium]